MEGNGVCGLDPDKLDRKFRNLKKTFNNIKVRNRSTGQRSTRREFFEQMEIIFEDDLAVNGTLATNLTEEENDGQLLEYTEFLEGCYDETNAQWSLP